jgi:UDP-2,3-diacylglucosamine pyrophosphatase LpxH
MNETAYSTVWLSDVHLGSRACRVEMVLDFLRRTRCETLYLVGDIIDVESMRDSFYWPTSHTEVLRMLLRKSQEGTRIIYIPGNHDDDMRALIGLTFGNIEVRARYIHTTRDGRRLLVLHGDEFDAIIEHSVMGRIIGSVAYRGLLALNRLVHWLHEITGRPYWSLAHHVKSRLGKAQRYIETFRRASLSAARAEGVDGIVCGHIHKADMIERDGLVYYNDGDWVESCTALIEQPSGLLKLVTWQLQVVAAPLGEPIRDAA